jgi:hypothetical protein
MKSWLEIGVSLAVVPTIAFIAVHPSFDLQDTDLHGARGYSSPGPMVMATPAEFDGLSMSSLPSPEPAQPAAKPGPDFLDLTCVRLC